ncbi:LysR family transcriptional regulator [Georgenia sunbinii]|uniref:LysR family transcriptional regulator n=1 Tax=Georgenia sunbinii TaxID=3117728 RepID=UPI002F268EF1
MDVRTLRWFQQVADGLTLTELAAAEFTAQSGISRALARLDAEVGTPLLQRSGRTLRLTHAGSVLKRHVDAAIHELDDGMAALDQLLNPETGSVRVAFQPSLGSWLVPDLVSTFREEYPDVHFDLVPKRDELVSVVGRRAAADLEFTTRHPTEADLEWQQLVTESLLLAVPDTHHLAGRPTVDLSDCGDIPFVMIHPHSELRAASSGLLSRAGVSPTITFVCDDLPTMRAFVAAGLGVAIMPRPHGTEAERGALRYLPIADPDAKREVGIAWPSNRRLLPAVGLFRNHVLERRAQGLLQAGDLR